MPQDARLMAQPAVTVVIPARDAEATIARTLAGIAAQDLDGDVEVVVVDDGSHDRTAELASQAGAIVVRHDEPAGPADARNAGVARASAPLIAFTDADCVPSPGWLRAGVAALAVAELVQGCVLAEPGVHAGPFDHVIEVHEETLLYETANLFVRREWFDKIGGFRPFIDPGEGHFGEDIVFGWSVRRAGGRSAFAPDAVVHHVVIPRQAADWIRERRRLRLFPLITRAVPELRERYTLGVFLSPRSAKFDLALIGLAAVLRGRRSGLLLTLPYLAGLRRDRAWQRWVIEENLARVAGDAVAFASLVRGSVTAKTPVL
jgi:glycosyltransferase involved in cell wall biosynthesis